LKNKISEHIRGGVKISETDCNGLEARMTTKFVNRHHHHGSGVWAIISKLKLRNEIEMHCGAKIWQTEYGIIIFSPQNKLYHSFWATNDAMFHFENLQP